MRDRNKTLTFAIMDSPFEAAAVKGVGVEHDVLLRGPAVQCAVEGQTPGSFAVGGVSMGNPPRIDEDLQH